MISALGAIPGVGAEADTLDGMAASSTAEFWSDEAGTTFGAGQTTAWQYALSASTEAREASAWAGLLGVSSEAFSLGAYLWDSYGATAGGQGGCGG